MEVLRLGTIEPLLVAVRDRLENLTSLNDVTNLQYDVRKASDDTVVSANSTAVVVGPDEMIASCLIDTTLTGYEAGETYKLYLHWDFGSEHPKSRAIKFRVEDES